MKVTKLGHVADWDWYSFLVFQTRLSSPWKLELRDHITQPNKREIGFQSIREEKETLLTQREKMREKRYENSLID